MLSFKINRMHENISLLFITFSNFNYDKSFAKDTCPNSIFHFNYKVFHLFLNQRYRTGIKWNNLNLNGIPEKQDPQSWEHPGPMRTQDHMRTWHPMRIQDPVRTQNPWRTYNPRRTKDPMRTQNSLMIQEDPRIYKLG